MDSGQEEIISYLKDHNAPCAKCQYNLQGLATACCPECGYENNLQGIEEMIVSQEVHEYNWHQSIKWFQRCELLLTAALLLNIWIAIFMSGGVYARYRGEILVVLVSLTVLNEWFRFWVRLGYRKDTGSFRRIVRNVEMFVYLFTAIALIPIVVLGGQLVFFVGR